MGTINIPLANAVGTDVMVVEYGIGYNGTFAKYHVFKNYSHMHKIWGGRRAATTRRANSTTW